MALASGQDLVSLFRWWNNTGLALEVLLRNYLPSSGEHCYDNLRRIRYNTHFYFPKLTEGDFECEDGPQATSCQSLPYIYVYIYISSWRKWFWIQHFGVLAFQVKSQDETKVHVELIWPYLLNAYGQCLHTFLGTVRQNSQGVSFFFFLFISKDLDVNQPLYNPGVGYIAGQEIFIILIMTLNGARKHFWNLSSACCVRNAILWKAAKQHL